jgi:hypothetical protein
LRKDLKLLLREDAVLIFPVHGRPEQTSETMDFFETQFAGKDSALQGEERRAYS